MWFEVSLNFLLNSKKYSFFKRCGIKGKNCDKLHCLRMREVSLQRFWTWSVRKKCFMIIASNVIFILISTLTKLFYLGLKKKVWYTFVIFTVLMGECIIRVQLNIWCRHTDITGAVFFRHYLVIRHAMFSSIPGRWPCRHVFFFTGVSRWKTKYFQIKIEVENPTIFFNHSISNDNKWNTMKVFLYFWVSPSICISVCFSLHKQNSCW